ncbi:tRNA uridine-5-carboxymethylaminomethyl(34) synthesis GTPase MnmE [Pelagibacteraceae bacterium]|nr:tRNA uridine-5-carboxymethylaminomethyl(34) synthesis GTPase MnmE [Pelagibacteraceae bacterium]
MTIYAISTAPGTAGLAVIRVSGPRALEALNAIVRNKEFIHSKFTKCKFYHPVNHKHLDSGLAVYFKSPKSFTGEDVVELHIHGGYANTSIILSALASIKYLRIANQGEFTKRAFINNKIDLTGIEALGDLINSQTEQQHEQALFHMGGSLSKLYLNWRKKLIELTALIEVELDFADEDLPDNISNNLHNKIDLIIAEMETHLGESNKGEILRNGFKIAIIGEPNVGKSSLINLLAKRDVAIVSEIAGTTRDAIEVNLNIAGFPVVIVDTAGLRESNDKIENLGINIALTKIEESNAVIEVFTDPKKIVSKHNYIPVLNKIDLIDINKKDLGQAIPISVLNNFGIDLLINKIEQIIKNYFPSTSETIPTHIRYKLGVTKIIQSLNNAKDVNLLESPELVVEELRSGIYEIGRLTGTVDVEEYLEVIFKEFCIGK